MATAKKASTRPAAGKQAAGTASSKTAAAKSATKAAAAAPKAKAAAPAKQAATASKTKASPVKPTNAKQPAAKEAAAKSAASKSAASKSAASRPASKQADAAPTSKSAKATSKGSGTSKASAPEATPKAEAAATYPAVKGVTKDGIAYTKDFDVKFLTAQKALLIEERASLTGQANLLEQEANALIEEHEMGDVQFDDEGGEGDTMVVERERDLALSAQARQTIADIDAALVRLEQGTYGYSVVSFRPIPRERLEAIPWAEVLVEEKVGGIGRR
jgi:RNA polymerase-binding transcription factor DksA